MSGAVVLRSHQIICAAHQMSHSYSGGKATEIYKIYIYFININIFILYINIKVTLLAAGRGEHCSGGVYINHAEAAKSLETAFLGEKEVTNKKEGQLLERAKRFCKFLASLFLSVKYVIFQLKKTNSI